MASPSLRALLIPILALGAGCEDFLDPDFSEGEGEFDDLGHLGEEGAYDGPELDPVDVGDPFGPFDTFEAFDTRSLQIASVGEPTVWEDLDPAFVTDIRVGTDGFASIWLRGEEVAGSAWPEGDRIVVYGLTTWDFADDAVDGPVEAELGGTIAPAR